MSPIIKSFLLFYVSNLFGFVLAFLCMVVLFHIYLHVQTSSKTLWFQGSVAHSVGRVLNTASGISNNSNKESPREIF